MELVEAGEQCVVFVESLAEAEAWIDDDAVEIDAGRSCRGKTPAEFTDDEWHDLTGSERWKSVPVRRAPAGVHQDQAAGEGRTGFRHGGIPEEAADVIDDLHTGLDGKLRGVRAVGVDGQEGARLLLQDAFDDREDAIGFLLVGDGLAGAGTGGFAADVDDPCAIVQHAESGSDGGFGAAVLTAVGEGVGCDIEDAHDDGGLAEGEDAVGEGPSGMGLRQWGHLPIVRVAIHSRHMPRLRSCLQFFLLLAMFGCVVVLHAQRSHHPRSHPAAPAKGATLADAINTLIANPAVSRAHWGISVRTLDGQTVYAMNDAQFFQPASNAKIFTTAAAFALLPGNAVYTTNVVAEGTVDGAGTLHGALAILGSGDPTMSGRAYPYGLHSERPNSPLAAFEDMADQIVRAGVHVVDGGVIGDDSWYPLERYGTGWASDDLLWLYGAPVSALTVNDNAVFLNVLPNAAPAAPPAMMTAPEATTAASWNPATGYYTLANTAAFAPAGVPAHPGLDRPIGSLAVRLFGTLPADGYHAGIAIEDPAEYAAKALTELLKARGVVVNGQPSARHRLSNNTQSFVLERGQPLSLPRTPMHPGTPNFGAFHVLATHNSPPMAQDWTVTNKASQNLHAELALRTLGKLYGTDGTFAQGTRVVRQFLENAGIDPGDFFFYDGCGLSTGDLVTPRAATQLLLYASRQSWAEAFRATLPVGGTDGSLASRFTGAAVKGRVFAKTGTLNETNALSGYVQAASGKMLVFSILVNDHSPDSGASLPAMDAIVEAIAARD